MFLRKVHHHIFRRRQFDPVQQVKHFYQNQLHAWLPHSRTVHRQLHTDHIFPLNRFFFNYLVKFEQDCYPATPLFLLKFPVPRYKDLELLKIGENKGLEPRSLSA